VCRHINEKIAASALNAERKWLMPEVIFTQAGADHHIDSQGKFWRAMSFIDAAETHEAITGPDHAREIGWALGAFHLHVSDLPAGALADTLPGFHNTPLYLDIFKQAMGKFKQLTSPEINFCLKFINQRQKTVDTLEEARRAGKLFDRPIHGDPKVSNIMIDKKSGLAASLIDLDTVKPGLIQYDIGDCLRSGCNPLGEDDNSAQSITFDLDLCHEILEGYLDQAGQFLTAYDFDSIYDAARIIAFELGLRYFTDFLHGNIYFKITSPEQNLHRAMVQFYLTQSIESQEKKIRSLVASLA
jgi:Ser/Thr protein kinase RdoA (MazF antagonist)